MELARGHLEQAPCVRPLEVGGVGVVRKAVSGVAQSLDAVGERRPVAELQHERPPGGAQRGVDSSQHSPQAGGAVRREQLESVRLFPATERCQRLLERLACEYGGVRFLELSEARIETGLERVRPEQPVAEAVDRGDPGSVELPSQVVARHASEAPSGFGPAARRRSASCR